MNIARVIFGLILLASGSHASAAEMRLTVDGLAAPIGIADPNDGTGRLFIQEQQGIIQVLGPSGTLWTPLLDLRAQLFELEEVFEERGLLGLALHPDFAINGRVYGNYSAPLRPEAPKGWNYTRKISELTLAPGAASIDPSSDLVLITLDWPSRKHNGGGLAFGRGGYLYIGIGIGDGGGAYCVGKQVLSSAFDVPETQLYCDRLAQDVTSLFGSVLRIDVDQGFPGYSIPPSNPFVRKPGRDEIYAWGFRNPYRLGGDTQTGAVLVTAISETLWEAIYMIDGRGNFGWPLREGTHCVDRTKPRDPPLTCGRTEPNGFWINDPVVEYPNMQVMDPATKVDAVGVGTTVVSARFYRGSALPDLAGKLIFAVWSVDFRAPSGQLFVATPAQRYGDLWPFEQLELLDTRIASLDADATGELYILTNDELEPFGTTGEVFKLVA